MLQQILSDMYVDPELLAELDDEQKQILFCKMREEQVRRWLEHEKAYEEERKSRKFVPSRDKKSVQFLLGLDGQPWTWVMGEHKNDRNIDDILEDEARKKARIIAEKETDQLLLSEDNELDKKFTEALLIENNNNDISEVPPPEPKSNPPNKSNSALPNKVFNNIKMFENCGTPDSSPVFKPNVPKISKKFAPVVPNLKETTSAPEKNGLSTTPTIANSKPTNDLTPTTKTETKSNASVRNNIRNFNIGLSKTSTEPVKPTAQKDEIATKYESVKETKSEINGGNAKPDSFSDITKPTSTDSKLSFVNDYNGVLGKPAPPSWQSPVMKSVAFEPVKYRAPKPPVSTKTDVQASPLKLDDQAVRRIIMGEESPITASSEKVKLRRKPSKEQDSWLLQQKEKVKERLKEQRSTEIYQQITEGRKRISQIADEINKEQDEIWKEQERKAKEAEKQIRDLARKARELHRRSSMMEDDKPEIKPKPTQTTSRSRDARLYTKPQIIDWFNKEEVPKNVARDLNTDEVAIWFHGIINREQAEHLLQDSPTGTFLVRLNDRIKGYVISYKTSDRCKHYLIDASSGNYQFFGANQIVHLSLTDLVRFHKTKPISSPGQEYLTLPCPQPDGTPNYASLLS